MKKLLLFYYTTTLLVFADHTIKDMAQREVSVSENIHGIVSVGGTPAINAFLFAFKKGNIIHNGIENDRLQKMPFWRHQMWFMPKLFSLPQVSTNPPTWTPLFEKLAKTQFDIALVNNPTTASLIEKKGFKAAVINWHGKNNIQKSMSFLGELFNMQYHAKAYNEYYDKVVKKIFQKTDGLKKKKSALYIRLNNLMMPMVTTANSVFEKAGAVAAASKIKKEHVSIDMEKLFVLDPDYLFVWGKKDLQLAYKNPKFRNLKAVKNKHVYAVPMGAHFWTHYTPEQILCIQWVAKKIYPELFADLDMEKEAKGFYKKFMGVELSKNQIQKILNISNKGN
jgi:iron complex transport system substrate-binding protein